MTAPSTMEMDAPEEWVKRYLAVLGVDRAAPSPAALADLTRAHVGAVNFENTTSILRRAAHPTGPVPPLDPEALLTNWERGSGGGVCYELAGMFGRLLAELGYQVFPILGQISFPASHQALLVELESGRVLVDIGNGAPFFDPIPLEGVFEVRHASLAYRFRPGDRAEEWLQERWIKGAWERFCRFDLGPLNATEQATGYQLHHTLGESWVVDRLRLVRCLEAELHVVRVARAQIEARRAQPACYAVLDHVAALEDA